MKITKENFIWFCIKISSKLDEKREHGNLENIYIVLYEIHRGKICMLTYGTIL
jgi:hypothetical protein